MYHTQFSQCLYGLRHSYSHFTDGETRHSQFKSLSRFTRLAGGDVGPSRCPDSGGILCTVHGTPGGLLRCCSLWNKCERKTGPEVRSLHGECLQGTSCTPLSRGETAWGLGGHNHRRVKCNNQGNGTDLEAFWLVCFHQNRILIGVSHIPCGKSVHR